ncbi:MAG: hypothetical protein AAB851_00775 [Patescibacteria group bacterium]
MAIISQEQQMKKQKVMAAAAAGILVVAGLVVYFVFLRQPAAPETSKIIKVVPQFEKAGKTFLNLGVLESPVFKSLNSYVELPIVSEEKGRANPFLSY